MELASTGEPWTVAVPWARHWQRRPRPNVPVRPPAAVAGSPVAPAPAEPAAGAWLAALEALERACRDRRGLDGEVDPWALAMADHEVYRARGHVRQLAAALDLFHGV
jgi:hypothetical protein